jgi:prepilin-type N-terminal cleavage/methylation domain-containing protein
MAKPRKDGFTLIEMLTVLVIVGVLVALTIPAVTNLMKSGGVTAASREVSNVLGLARQYAITRRVYARVVFPYQSTASWPDMWYRTYAVMTNRDNTVVTGWGYLSKWEYLPIGAVFLDTNPSGSHQIPSGGGALDDSSSLNSQPGLPFPDTLSGGVGQLAYIEFGPTGTATAVPPNGTAQSTLAITEGFTTVNGSTATLQPTASKTITNTLANQTIISVDSLVGRIQVTRP